MLHSPPGRHRRPKKAHRKVTVPVAVAIPLVTAGWMPSAVPLLPWSETDASERPAPTAGTQPDEAPTAYAADRMRARASRLADRGEPLLAARHRETDRATPTPTKTRARPTRTPAKVATATARATTTPTSTPRPTAPTRTPTRTPTPEPTRTYGPSVADAKAYARSVLSDAEWEALDQLAMHESSWDPHAVNPTSGAYGIPQALPPEKMATAGDDWRDNATTQIKWMINYCEERYGGVIQAWEFWQANHWY